MENGRFALLSPIDQNSR